MEVFQIEVGATIEFNHNIFIGGVDHGQIRTIVTVLGVDNPGPQVVHLGVTQIGHDGKEMVSKVTETMGE